jgi:hypothetical protein
MIPEEVALVQRMKDEPFALVGVNSDTRENFDKEYTKSGMTWRSAMQGTTTGPIPTLWNVSGWPTLYLIDAQGKIRQKYVGSPGKKTLESEIEKLIDEAKAAKKQ